MTSLALRFGLSDWWTRTISRPLDLMYERIDETTERDLGSGETASVSMPAEPRRRGHARAA